MDEKNSIMEGFGEFLLGLVKVCIAIALMTGTVVVSAFLAIQGAFFIRDTYGFHGLAIAWAILFTILLLVCGHLKRSASKAGFDARGTKPIHKTTSKAQG